MLYSLALALVLHAAERGTAPVCVLLMTRADLLQPCTRDDALYVAAEQGHAELCRELTRQPGVTPGGRAAALSGAAARGHARVCRLLLEAGAEDPQGDARRAALDAHHLDLHDILIGRFGRYGWQDAAYRRAQNDVEDDADSNDDHQAPERGAGAPLGFAWHRGVGPVGCAYVSRALEAPRYIGAPPPGPLTFDQELVFSGGGSGRCS